MPKTLPGILAWIPLVLVESAVAGAMPEYSAAEARKHIGEKAVVVGKVDCIGAGRSYHYLQLDGCSPNSPLWIIVNDDASGPELNVNELKGVTIAVSGKIERPQTQPWLVVKSTTQIVPRTKLNPDYLGRARQKESQGDLDGAIAEFDHAIELNHESTAYMERAEVHMEKGDSDGAISDYDQLIERYPEGVYYLKRAGLKMKKSDYAGVIADSSRAIELLARHYASHPNDHSTFILAQAYSERGEAKEAMGDAAGAIPDYENAVKNDRAPIYKEKLRTAKAEAAAKKVAITQPTAQAAQSEQSSNKDKDEVSPESIAAAFVQAYSAADVDAVAGLYGDRVDYTNSGVISNAAIRKQAQEYFARWPVRQWSLAGPVKTTSMGPSRQKVIFSANYDASNPQTNKHVSGIARETLIVASDANGAMKIVSQREQTSKRGSSQPGKETSQGLGPNADDDQHANGGTLDEFMGDVTGTVVYADEKRGYIEIDREKHDGRGNFEVVLTGDLHTPKVGEKVSVHWYSCGGGSIHVSNRDRPHCADKIEKVGNAEAGLNRENSAATQQEFDPGSYFRLTTKWQGDAKSLDIVNDGKNNNRPILANTGNFSGQYWKIAPVGDGYYRLTTKWQGTAKSLDVVSDGKNNNQLILAKTGNYSGQYWKITPVGDGYYRLTTQWQGAGKSLDIVNDGTNNNQPILAHTGNYSGQFWRLTAAAFSLAQAERPEKLKSPYGKYSIEVVRGTEDSLVLSHGGEVIAKVPTSVGPVGSLFEALWHKDGSYVAVNKQRSSRPGGDSMWILALPTGKVLRKPDDAFWNELEERADAYIDEKHLSETKVSLTLIATGWGKGGLRFRLEAWFGEMEVRYFFDGTVEPLNLRTINDWKVSTTKS